MLALFELCMLMLKLFSPDHGRPLPGGGHAGDVDDDLPNTFDVEALVEAIAADQHKLAAREVC
jgi:hypothetical protein